MSEHERFLDLCAVYALGCIEPDELRELEELLAAGGAEREAELRSFVDTTAVLAEAAPPATPPAALRERVLAPRRRMWRWAVAAAALLGAALLFLMQRETPVEYALASTGAGPAPAGRVLFKREAGTARIELTGAKAPAGKDFELWVLRDKPVSLGVVRAGADGTVVIERAGLTGTVNGFAISLEPAGGARGGPPTTVVATATP